MNIHIEYAGVYRTTAYDIVQLKWPNAANNTIITITTSATCSNTVTTTTSNVQFELCMKILRIHHT